MSKFIRATTVANNKNCLIKVDDIDFIFADDTIFESKQFVAVAQTKDGAKFTIRLKGKEEDFTSDEAVMDLAEKFINKD